MDDLDLLQIHQTWTDLREARVKDGFIFRVSRYFIDHWLRLLGPKAAWAVVDLQQRCYLANADSCQVSLKELCAAAGAGSTATMQAIVDAPLTRWFFAKQTTHQRRADKVVRGKNRYTLQMSDPLTPQHQGQVARVLTERLRDGTIPAVHGPNDLIQLVSDLPPLSSTPSDSLPAWATREPLNLRQIALRVLLEAGIGNVPANLADEAALRQRFADAQARITQPTRIALATHYFRTEWVPQLGATQAWLIMILRSRCYWNKESGEVRDTCLTSNRELAGLLGTSARTVGRILRDPLVTRFMSAQGRVYEPRASDGRKTPSRTRFQVHLTLDPLTPPDEAAFAQILLSDAARYGLDPETGQMDMLDILDIMSQMTQDEITHRRGQWNDKIEFRSPQEVKSSDKIEKGRSRPGEPETVLDDKIEFGSHPAGREGRSETLSSDKIEIRTLEFWAEAADPEGQSSDKIEFRGECSDKSEIRPGQSSDKIETIPLESSDKIEKQYLNTLENTTVEQEGSERQQQQYGNAAAAPPLYHILVKYGIQEPALSRILANPQVTPALARAWMLYADNEAGLNHKPGYVVRRLVKSPPDVPADPDLLLVAGLGDERLAVFAQRYSLESRMAASVSFGDADLETQYRAWLRFHRHGEDSIYDGESSDETAVGHDGRRAFRWRPDVG